jgi:hypothetical protein
MANIISALELEKLSLKKTHTPYKNKGEDETIKECWINEKKNFILIKNSNGLWDIYYGCDFAPNLIKRDVSQFSDIKSLLSILT